MTTLRLVWLSVLVCVGLLAPSRTMAQSASLTLNSPAFNVGQRLDKQAVDAEAYSKRLTEAGNAAQAAFEHDIAHRRSIQARKKYAEVTASRTFGKTALGAEAEYRTAWLLENIDKDRNNALQTLKTLQNNHKDTVFPDKAIALADFHRVAQAVDLHSQTTYPDKICYTIMDFLVRLTGAQPYSYWLAILIFSLVVKLALTPLSNKQYASMKEMQKLQPHIKEVQAKHKGNPAKMQEEMQKIYKEHGVNPVAGCGPLLIQIPIMIALYYTIRVYEYQFSHGTFFWIGSKVSHLYPSFLATDLSQMDIPLLILYALSMYVQQKMTVPADPQAAEQQRMMAIYTPFLSTYFFLQYKLPAAFVLYYLIFNVLSMAQQYYYMNKRKGDTPIQPVVTGKALTIESLSSNGNNGTGVAKKSPPSTNGASAAASGAKPTARGTIAPKVHPKKKKR